MFGKRGKYEAVPTEAAVKYKKKSVKSNLLSAYFTSLLCLILCATMFLSTSMAWFTSEVNNSGNEIYVGTLDVKLMHGADELKANSDPIYKEGVVWTPDTLQVDDFTILSNGTLGFSYHMSMSISYDGVSDADKALAQEAAKYITVWVKEGESGDPADYAAITADGSGWKNIGTLATVLNGTTIVNGKMDPVLSTVNLSGESVTSRKFAVALHMDALAPNEIQGAKLSNITIKLVAAQTASVNVVFTEQELKDALAAGGNVLLMNNISVDADNKIVVPAGVSTNLYLNGHTISGVGDEAQGTAVITNNGTLTIFDETGTGKIELLNAVVSASNGYATDAIFNDGVLIVNGGTIQNNLGQASYAIDNNTGATTIVNGGTVINTAGTAIRAYGWDANTASTVTINGGNVIGTYGIRLQNLSTSVASKINVTVNGGTLTGTDSTYHMALYSLCNDGSNVSVALNGGTYYGDVALGGGNKANPETFSWNENACTVYGDIYRYTAEGYTMIHENKFVVVYNADELSAAVAGDASTIYLRDGAYDLKGNQEDGLTIIGLGEGVRISNLTNFAGNGNYGAIWQNVNFENVIFTEKVYTMADGAQSTFKNCTFEQGFRGGYSRGVIFENCTFYDNSEGFAMHFEKVYTTATVTNCKFVEGTIAFGDNGDGKVIFNNCTFSGVTTRTEYFDAWASCELNDCTFAEGTEIWLEHWETGETVTLNNTTGATVVQK